MKKYCIYLLLALMVIMPVKAQVEFNVDLSKPLKSFGSFDMLNEQQKTIVDFLYLTQKDEHCTTDIGAQASIEIFVCVFPDPTTATQHLYIKSLPYRTTLPIYYNDEVVAVLDDDQGLANLRDGEYMVQALYHDYGGRQKTLLSTVIFSVGNEVTTITPTPQVSSTTQEESISQPLTMTITSATARLNIRSGPGTSYEKTGALSRDEQAIAIGRNGSGTWIMLENGWVYAEYTKTSGDIMALSVTSN